MSETFVTLMLMKITNSVQICIYTIVSFNLSCKYPFPKIWTQVAPLRLQEYGKEIFSDRCFSVCGPRLWNALPPHIKDAESTNQFKVLLKTYFFKQAYSR